MKNNHELINLAKQAIESRLENKELTINKDIKQKYNEKRACFVTLTINNQLRGCIGSLIAHKELWKDIIENSINAAFYDPRFYPLTKEEFNKIQIEISILTIPKKIEYKDITDLKNKIYKKGVILKKSYNSATYLPQVWEQLPDSDDFLSSLCEKASLSSNIWKKEKLDVSVYDVEKIK